MLSVLKKPHLAGVAAEFQKSKKANGKRPEWYSLFGGPQNLRKLAESVGRLSEYDFLYRYWSNFAHAHNLAHVTFLKSGKAGEHSLRFPGELRQVALMGINIQLRATRVLLQHYRPGESVSAWYQRDVKPKLDVLSNSSVTFNSVEEE